MLNRVILTGRLTSDAEAKEFKEGKGIIKFSLAVSNGKDKEGKETTSFFNCDYWCFNVKNICSYLKKGLLIGVDGKLLQQTWKDAKTKENRSTIVINVSSIEFLSSKPKEEKDGLPF